MTARVGLHMSRDCDECSSINRNNTTVTQRIVLVQENLSLWTRGTVYPTPGSHTICVPFTFSLPSGIPPAFSSVSFGKHAGIQYFLEVVGVRSGLLKANRRVVRPLAVLPAGRAGIALRSRLQAGWTGRWKTVIHEDSKVRKGIWGDYAKVKMEVRLILDSGRVYAQRIYHVLFILSAQVSCH